MSYTNEQLTESLKKNLYENLSEVLNIVREMKNNGTDLNTTNEQFIVAKFRLSNIKDLYQRLNSDSSNENIKQTVYNSVTTNEQTIYNSGMSNQNAEVIKEVLTEDKFDKDIIPTTKNVGMIGSVIIGGLMAFNGSWMVGLFYAIGGIMATLGLCVLLEGISTIIKLLRKISEK